MIIDARDDGTPRGALDVAGQAVRAFNHRSVRRFCPERQGWRYVPDAYRCLGELTHLTGMLPQVGDHLAESIVVALAAGQAALDYGEPGTVGVAIAAAGEALGRAEQAARELYRAYADAQNAISRVHYSGPEMDGDDQ
jgi:hypothetical protein